jgi:hypothetical protein
MKKSILFGILVLLLINFILVQGAMQENQGINNSENNKTSNLEENQSSNNSKGKLITSQLENKSSSQIRNIVRNRNILGISSQGEECPENCTCTGSVTKCDIGDGKREMTVTAGKSGNVIVQVKNINMSTNVTLYHHNGKVYRNIGNNQTKEINYLPDKVKEKVEEKLRQRNCTLEDMTLDEDGIYKVRVQKKARLFLLFPVREEIDAQIDSETGEIIRIKNPWWGFLARDSKEKDFSE